MMAYKMTKKGQDLIKTKMINGEMYALCDITEDGRELWLALDLPEPRKCSACGYSGIALDEHHIHGRKNSDETITLCSNCHREYHAGTRQL
jgi:hypothetical protein